MPQNKNHNSIPSKQAADESGQPIRRVSVATQKFEGPLPPPTALKAYDEILPGAAERILTMAEKEGAHRHMMERRILSAESRDGLLGLLSGLAIGLSAIWGGILCVMRGFQISGASVILSAIASLVGVFVYGSRQRRQREESN